MTKHTPFPSTLATLDYSITSPCMCLVHYSPNQTHTPPDFADCQFFYTTTKKAKAGSIADNITGIYIDRESLSGDMAYFDTLARTFLDLIVDQPEPTVFLENYAYSRRGKVFNIAEATGLFKYLCYTNDIPCDQTISSTSIKKVVTGSGRASKGDGYDRFVELTGLDLKSLTKETTKSENPSSDIVDSYFLSRYVFEKKLIF